MANSRVVLGTHIRLRLLGLGHWALGLFIAHIAQQMKLLPTDEKGQAVAVGQMQLKKPPLIAPCAVEPVVGTKTVRPAALSEVHAGKEFRGVA